MKLSTINSQPDRIWAAISGPIATAAQVVYDAWDGEGGGICDEIAQEIISVILDVFPDAKAEVGGQDGDDHAYVVTLIDGSVFMVDILPSIYEQGGGYNWTKIPNVRFTPKDVVVYPLDLTWEEVSGE